MNLDCLFSVVDNKYLQHWLLLLYVYKILTPKSVCAIVALAEIDSVCSRDRSRK